MNKKIYSIKSLLIISVLAGLTACGDDNSGSATSGPENSEELGECTANNDGAEAYVEEKDEHYVCQNGEWVKKETPTITSSSSAAVSSSSGKTGVSSSSEAESSSSSKATSDKSVYDASANTLKDLRNDKTYKTTTIGRQVWMAENLNYEYNEGTAQSFCNDNKTENCTKYGRLYTWDAAMDKAGIFSKNGNPARGVCPKDWHLPSMEEFGTLFWFIGGQNYAGKLLKSKSEWDNFKDITGNGTDEFGFNALPVGYIMGSTENGQGSEATFWSTTETNDDDASTLYLVNASDAGFLGDANKTNAHSVRCIWNEQAESSLDVKLGLCAESRDHEIATIESEDLSEPEDSYICDQKDGTWQWRKPTSAEINKAAGEKFLAKNRTAEGVVTTESGLQYKVLTEGAGATPTDEDKVKVLFTLKLLDGTEPESSNDPNKPFEFPVSAAIPGWVEMLKLMKAGGKVITWIPYDLAYGSQGKTNIPPYSVLVCEIELIDVIRASH